jgi:hypothetical protein
VLRKVKQLLRLVQAKSCVQSNGWVGAATRPEEPPVTGAVKLAELSLVT